MIERLSLLTVTHRLFTTKKMMNRTNPPFAFPYTLGQGSLRCNARKLRAAPCHPPSAPVNTGMDRVLGRPKAWPALTILPLSRPGRRVEGPFVPPWGSCLTHGALLGAFMRSTKGLDPLAPHRTLTRG